ncbi:MAG: acyl-CoA dehydratase activase [Gemmatimonadaceae bacterium]|nr:acyl-CoA dehydratase activase [Gemmatimonadaceae bacterium]
MPDNSSGIAAGVDVGTECVKAVVITDAGRTLGRSVLPTRGYFQVCAYEALTAALHDAGSRLKELAGVGATGFGMASVPGATVTVMESAAHARGAFHHMPHAMTLANIGGGDPHVIAVDATGGQTGARGMRRCAVGVGSFLTLAARRLDVGAAQLDELADAAAGDAAVVTSYCSVFSASEVLERLREGATREQVALGCVRSVAQRVLELGSFTDPVVVSGGVAEYFPGVLRALESLLGLRVTTLPEPIYTGAFGAALAAFSERGGRPVLRVVDHAGGALY